MDKIRQLFARKQTVYALYFSLIAGTALITLAIVIIITTPQNITQDKKISEEERQKVLEEVIRNNPKGIIDITKDQPNSIEADTQTSSGTPAPLTERARRTAPVDPSTPVSKAAIPAPRISAYGDVENLTTADIIAPDLGRYNYSYTEESITSGPAGELCPTFSQIDTKHQYYRYFDPSHSFYKSVNTSPDGKLVKYSLGRYGTDLNEYYDYIGGQTAGVYLFKINPDFSNAYQYTPDSYPKSYPVISYPLSYPKADEIVSSYFGGSTRFVDIINENGKTYYLIERTFYGSCDEGNSGYNNNIVLINRQKVDADDYSIIGTEMYLREVSPENLIYRSSAISTRELMSPESASAFFNFEFEAERVIVNYRDYVFDSEKEATKVVNYLKQVNQKIVIPDNPLDLYSFYGKNFPEAIENQRYYLDRPYYPDDADGQTHYDDVIDNFSKRPELEYYFANSNFTNNMAIEVFDGNLTLAEILRRKFGATRFVSEMESYEVAVIVNNSALAAQKAVRYFVSGYVPVSYPLSYPVSYPISYPGGIIYFDIYLSFTSGGKTFLLYGYNAVPTTVEDQKYSLITPTDAKFASLEEQIRNSYFGYYFFDD